MREILLVEEPGVLGGNGNCDFFVQELYASLFFFFFHNNVVRPGIKNKNVKIKCSAHDAFLE